MKTLILLLPFLATLHAGIFSSDRPQERSERAAIHESFRQNVSDANDIVKRGEYDKMVRYRTEMLQIKNRVAVLTISESEKRQLRENLGVYERLVSRVGETLKTKAPDLNDRYTQLLRELPTFNKRLASIGLRELLNEWRNLGKIKNRFVKRPDARLAQAFEQKWVSVTVIITELYLDEEMEAPLMEYLDAYRAYFTALDGAYRSVGYADVARLKPLSYEIKSQLELSVPYS